MSNHRAVSDTSSNDEHALTLPPFHGARWLAFVLAVLVAFAAYQASKQLDPWVEPDYWLPVLIACAVFICCCAEAGAQARNPDARIRPLTRIPYTFAMLMVYAFPIWVFIGFITPANEPPSAFGRASELPLAANAAISEMQARFAAGAPLNQIGKGVAVMEVGTVSAATVSEAGVITLRNDKSNLRVVLTPHLDEKAGESAKVIWVCVGEPRRMMPKRCRGD